MQKVKRIVCVMILSAASVACSSPAQHLQPVSNQREQYASPAAWAMQPPSNSLRSCAFGRDDTAKALDIDANGRTERTQCYSTLQ
jgi:hypothetical protein